MHISKLVVLQLVQVTHRVHAYFHNQNYVLMGGGGFFAAETVYFICSSLESGNKNANVETCECR
jgi:hypothetical protein